MTELPFRLQRLRLRLQLSGTIVLVTVLATVYPTAQAAPAAQPTVLYQLFQDHAVLQRGKPIAVWGQAGSGEVISLSLRSERSDSGGSTVSAQADASGRWNAVLPARDAGGPFELTARSNSGASATAHDVMVGDVFLCSGQSNMEMSVLRASDSEGEIRNSAHDSIRLLSVEHAATPQALATFETPVTWQIAAPATISDWSAVCYFFARELQSSTQVPIGLVQSAWSGSNIRPWLSSAALRAHGGYATGLDILATYARDPAAAQDQFARQWESWWRNQTSDRVGHEPWNTQTTASQWQTAPAGLGDWRHWGVPELKNFTGLLWYRTHLKLTAEQAKSVDTLSLGAINQVDETWINGRAVGNTFGYGTDRTYSLPRGMLHAGDNVLVINVLSTYGEGGLLGDGAKRALHLSTGESIPLNGVWQYRVVPSAAGYPPRAPWESVGGLSTLYNGMIAPLGAYGLRGVLWYQGESNTGESNTYRSLLEALMADWRRQFGADLPFLIVQLPDFGTPPVAPSESGWAEVREAQRLAVANDLHAGLAVTIDIGDPHNLHPTNKQDVGKRLARVARHVIFGEAGAPSGPTPVSAVGDSEQIAVEFRDIDTGLVAYSHDSPIGFELCGDAAGTCVFATARIAGSRILLSVPGELAPKRVRYCWANSPVCTLFDRSGVPAGPFELPILAPPARLTSEQDHQRIMDLLGITQLRSGPDGDPTSPHAANFDETKVPAGLRLPDPLVLADGRRVKTRDSWWNQRRPQLVEAFDSQVYGRVPRDVPKVKWQVTRTSRDSVEGVHVLNKEIVGHVDNSAYPLINVDIQLSLTTPAEATGPVPVIMEFGLAAEQLAALRKRFTEAQWATFMGSGPSWQSQVLQKGWGYALLIPTSIQADNGAGLAEGVIGLTNRGQPRKLDDWGALRAWAWGASRALDYLETDASVDARQVGLEGLSRYGKATLVAMAYEPRLAIAFVGSSGEGGAKLSRRNFGEQVENLAATSEYHWMAGNFLKYAGPLTVNDLPVDSHELIALCAPRPVFVSSGSQQVEGGWVDAKGMFLGAVGAGPVYKLLGKKDLGTTQFPPMETTLADGDIAFRQHSGGHTDGPNWPTFLTFAARYIKAGS